MDDIIIGVMVGALMAVLVAVILLITVAGIGLHMRQPGDKTGALKSGWRGLRTWVKGGDEGSFQRPLMPVKFPSGGSTAVDDLYEAGETGLDAMTAEGVEADIRAMSGRHLFGEKPLPAEPLTADMLRFVADYGSPSDDPARNTALIKESLGFSNIGTNIWA